MFKLIAIENPGVQIDKFLNLEGLSNRVVVIESKMKFLLNLIMGKIHFAP